MTLPKRALTVNGDPVRIEQIILDLLNNAGKYTPVGGRIGPLRRAGEWAELLIADNGVGIADDLRPRLFQLFQQGNRDLARGEGGLGHRPQRGAPAGRAASTARSRRAATGRAGAASCAPAAGAGLDAAAFRGRPAPGPGPAACARRRRQPRRRRYPRDAARIAWS